ncbi:MAG: 4Fe-4S binding protein, partial [Treponema sp.]|nr:4Fe-4S binding protein [Treponema sp.]
MTRREFLKKAILGTGLLFLGCENVLGQERRGGSRGARPIRSDNPAIRLDRSRCRRRCSDCRSFCRDAMGVFGRTVPPGEDACIHCGQCAIICPPRAITERYHYREVSRAIAAAGKIVVATTAPAIRV